MNAVVRVGSAASRVWELPAVTRLRREGAIAPIVAFVTFLSVYLMINPGLLSPAQLQTASNLVVPVALVALGQMIVVLVGGIDISVGAIMSLCNVVFASQLLHFPVYIAIPIALGLGLACGLFNGLLVAYAGFPAIAVTLASAFIFGSLAKNVLDRPGGGVTMDFYQTTSGRLLPSLPISLVWLAIVAIILWFILQRTAFGRHVYGVGSSREAVRAAGLNEKLTQLMAFGLSGLVVAVGAIMLAGATVTGDPKSGDPYVLSSIAAVALAGVAFQGGRGSIIGTVLAAFTLGLIGSLLFFARIDSAWQYAISAVIIVGVFGAPVVWRKMAFLRKGARS